MKFDHAATVKHKVKAQFKSENPKTAQENQERRKSSRLKEQTKPILEKNVQTINEPKRKRPKQSK